MDPRQTFAMNHLDQRWPSLEGGLIRDSVNWSDLPPGRPFAKRVDYNMRRNN